MLIRDSNAEFGETPSRAGNAGDGEWSPNAISTNLSREGKLLDVWFDCNRQAVENNTFFSPASEPGAPVTVIPERKERKWMHRRLEAGSVWEEGGATGPLPAALPVTSRRNGR